MGERAAGTAFVYDLKFSDRIAEAARQFGAEPLRERSGHAFLRARMRESGAVFGAEVSGHYFYRGLDGGDDGLYTACLLIEHLARSERHAGRVASRLPAGLHDARSAGVDGPAAASRESWTRSVPRGRNSRSRCSTACGSTCRAAGRWCGSSVTEPALTFRFEGLDWHALDDLVERFCDALPEIGDELWMRYRAAMGGEGR